MKRPSNARLEIWVKGRVDPFIVWLPTEDMNKPPTVTEVVFRRYVKK